MLGTWTIEIAFALVTVQLLVVFYLAYRRRSASTPHDRADSTEHDGEDSRVECRECGAENDPGYQYCRECTVDLSGESIPGYRYHSPTERSL
ncbi:DUF7577 domain-containing protein [Halalkalicoccus subterraneus]|uniref:DUF7577 domain-containing protein n=1 Tax=Halalkalicoccus subterraneus TaxID=2675002 RepID=UPI000EFD5689|nr:zinc ribbon domain-containing protein [Halalkalicoccus subterraneus]